MFLIFVYFYAGGCFATSCGDSDYEKFAKQYPGNHYQACCETGELL